MKGNALYLAGVVFATAETFCFFFLRLRAIYFMDDTE
jgi:hypothetical protein